MAVGGAGRGQDATGVADVAAAVEHRIRVEQLLVEAAPWHAYAVPAAHDGREVAHNDEKVLRVPATPEKRDGALFPVVAVNPLESGGVEIHLVKGGHLPVEPVQILHEPLQPPMVGPHVQQVPVQARLVIPPDRGSSCSPLGR